jgi:type VI secretion system protein ImpG
MNESEDLLSHYERELAHLQKELLQFEREHPQTAARLSISGGQTDEPYVQRMLQSAALLNARLSRRIDDRHPEFAEALIEKTFPAYLKRMPSCSIAQFDASSTFDACAKTVLIPHSTPLEHRPSLCQFRTAWDVTLAPLSITGARFSPPSAAPPLGAGRLPPDTTGIITIEFASPGRVLIPESKLIPKALRVYLHADRFLAAALIDAMLLCPRAAFVEVDGSGHWQALEKPPARAVGFDDAEAIVDEPKHAQQPALRLLMEYAAFPDKFRFIDLDFAALVRRAGPCGRLALHLPVAAHAASTSAVQRLNQLNADHLRLFCTPVINLFQIEAKPVDVVADTHTYPVALPSRDGAPIVIRSIESVYIMNGGKGGEPDPEIPPRRSRLWSPVGMFWLREVDALNAREATGCDTAIRFIDPDDRPVTPEAAKLGIRLTCTNGDSPSNIDMGAPEGDLHSDTLDLSGPVEMLVSPSAGSEPPRDDSALWRLVSALSPNHLALSSSSLAVHHDLLFQFAESGPPDAARYIRGITGISAQSIERMMFIQSDPMQTIVLGIEVTLTIDEAAFAGHALYIFAQLMERYLLRYAGNCCLELAINSHRGGEVYRGKPRYEALV